MLIVNIQIARTCNLRCSFCSHDKWEHETGFMKLELFYEILDSLKDDGCDTICFVSAQGEALLHPSILEMLTYAVDIGFNTNLVTNGTPLTEKRIDFITSVGLSSIQFSFCGYDKESYEKNYVGAKFEQVTRNLKQMIAKVGKTHFSINGVAPDQEYLKKTRGYLLDIGASPSSIRLQLAHNWGGTVKAGNLNQELGMYSHRDLSGAQLKICPLLISTPGIYIDGRVTACGCIDANGALEIGNIKTEKMSEIRAGGKYKAIMEAFESGDVSQIPLCRSCEIPYRPHEVI